MAILGGKRKRCVTRGHGGDGCRGTWADCKVEVPREWRCVLHQVGLTSIKCDPVDRHLNRHGKYGCGWIEVDQDDIDLKDAVL
jgi:hypothetical protein